MNELIQINKAIPLNGSSYPDYLISQIEKATHRIWMTIFIVDISLNGDSANVVRPVFKSLQNALWRGVDVKLIIGTSKIFDIEVFNATAQSYVESLNIPCAIWGKATQRDEQDPLHSKYVIFDQNLTIVGGHNWTELGLTTEAQSSVALDSNEMCEWLSGDFAYKWEKLQSNFSNPINN